MKDTDFSNYTLSVEGSNVAGEFPCHFCGNDQETKGGGPILMAIHKETGRREDVCQECAGKINPVAAKIYYDLEKQLTERLSESERPDYKIEIYRPLPGRQRILGDLALVTPDGERIECCLFVQDENGELSVQRFDRTEPEKLFWGIETSKEVIDSLVRKHNEAVASSFSPDIDEVDRRTPEQKEADIAWACRKDREWATDREKERETIGKLLTECGFENVGGIHWTKRPAEGPNFEILTAHRGSCAAGKRGRGCWRLQPPIPLYCFSHKKSNTRKEVKK